MSSLHSVTVVSIGLPNSKDYRRQHFYDPRIKLALGTVPVSESPEHRHWLFLRSPKSIIETMIPWKVLEQATTFTTTK